MERRTEKSGLEESVSSGNINRDFNWMHLFPGYTFYKHRTYSGAFVEFIKMGVYTGVWLNVYSIL